MKVIIRADKVIIEGYVNAIERFSKPLVDNRGRFTERIMTGAFARAIGNAKDGVFALLNHSPENILGNTSDASLVLREDNIGLYARVETSHARTMEKARAGKLVGWSFGFNNPKQQFKTNDTGMEERTITDLQLVEVSVLDDERNPAYYGTSIESRATDAGEEIEITERRAAIEAQPEYVTIRAEEGGDPSDGSGEDEESDGKGAGEEDPAEPEAPDFTEHKARINQLTVKGIQSE